jgi:microcystin degradation protein MlrC
MLIGVEMRIITGTISHETNVLSNIATDLDEFKKRGVFYGDELFARFNGTKTPVGGIIDGCRAHGFELIPTVYAAATPSGTITADTFDTLLSDLLEGIRHALDIDAVVLHLHGAGVSESYPDIEGKILEEVRKIVGNIPLACTLDFHANFTHQMVNNADLLIGYDTYPHIDGYERGIEAVNLTARMLDGTFKPTKAFRQPPMLPALQAQFTGRHPMRTVLEEAYRMEALPGVETITVAAGFPWSDIHEAGMSFVVTTHDNQALADELAQTLHDMVWHLRREFLVNPTPIREALRRIRAATHTPIVLADIGDNPGAGGPEDGTYVLQAILEAGLDGGVIAVIWDPGVVTQALDAGDGQLVDIQLGGHTDDLHGEPLAVTARVKYFSDGTFVNEGPMGTGVQADMGATVVLDIGGNDVIVTSKRHQPTDLQLYKSLGIDVSSKRFVVVKSSVHFRAAHDPIAAEIIELDVPGLTSPRLAGFGLKHVRRPIFPLDAEMLGITEMKQMDQP